MQTIGFLTYGDFAAELSWHDQIGTVRVQDYYRRSEQHGLPYLQFFVEAAAVCDDGVLVCRFALGGGFDVEGEHAHRDRQQENAKKACRMLSDDLLQRGFAVGPGLISAAAKSKTTATPDGLWRFEEGEDGRLPRLVPGPEVE